MKVATNGTRPSREEVCARFILQDGMEELKTIRKQTLQLKVGTTWKEMPKEEGGRGGAGRTVWRAPCRKITTPNKELSTAAATYLRAIIPPRTPPKTNSQSAQSWSTAGKTRSGSRTATEPEEVERERVWIHHEDVHTQLKEAKPNESSRHVEAAQHTRLSNKKLHGTRTAQHTVNHAQVPVFPL